MLVHYYFCIGLWDRTCIDS